MRLAGTAEAPETLTRRARKTQKCGCCTGEGPAMIGRPHRAADLEWGFSSPSPGLTVPGGRCGSESERQMWEWPALL